MVTGGDDWERDLERGAGHVQWRSGACQTGRGGAFARWGRGGALRDAPNPRASPRPGPAPRASPNPRAPSRRRWRFAQRGASRGVNMEELLRRELGCSFVKATGHSGGGCISQGQTYDTDRGRVFVKVNPKAEVRVAAGGSGRVGRTGVPASRSGMGAGGSGLCPGAESGVVVRVPVGAAARPGVLV